MLITYNLSSKFRITVAHVDYANVLMLGFRLIFFVWTTPCCAVWGRTAPIINFSLVFISEIVWAKKFLQWTEVNVNKAKNCHVYGIRGYSASTPHFGPALYCIFSTVNTVIGLCLSRKSVYLWRNLCMIILYFIVHARCRHKESSYSLSHLLMSSL